MMLFYFDVWVWNVVNGVVFGDFDVCFLMCVVLIGKMVVQNFFGDDDLVGKIMCIQQNFFMVVGVFGSKGQNFDGCDQDDIVIILFSIVQCKVFGMFFLGLV